MARDQRMQWGSFIPEFSLWIAPWICAGLLALRFALSKWLVAYGIAVPAGTEATLLIVGGAAWMLRIWYRYHGEFQNAGIGSLIEDVEVSQMRPRAVKLKGKILGRGIPGALEP